MKRNRNAVVRAFESAFVAFMADHGVTPSGSVNWHPETPAFEIQTAAGRYSFHYDTQIVLNGRSLNHIGVTGRFDNASEARKLTDCNPFTGKWNFDSIGHVETEDLARAHAHNIARRILRLRHANATA